MYFRMLSPGARALRFAHVQNSALCQRTVDRRWEFAQLVEQLPIPRTGWTGWLTDRYVVLSACF